MSEKQSGLGISFLDKSQYQLVDYTDCIMLDCGNLQMVFNAVEVRPDYLIRLRYDLLYEGSWTLAQVYIDSQLAYDILRHSNKKSDIRVEIAHKDLMYYPLEIKSKISEVLL